MAVLHSAGRHNNQTLRFTVLFRARFVIERDGSVHVRPEKVVRVVDAHLHLYGGFRAVGFGRHLLHKALILAVWVSVGSNGAFLLRPQLREIILADIEFHLQVVQIGHGHQVALGAFFAYESVGDKLTLLHVAVENGAGDRRTDDGILQLVVGVGKSAFCLRDLPLHLRNLLLARAEYREIQRSLQAGDFRFRRIQLGLRIVEALLRKNTAFY